MDKGVGVVVMNTIDYNSKLNDIIDDKERFKKMDYNLDSATNVERCHEAPWIARENSIATYIRKYIQPMVDKSTYWKLLPRGSQPGRLYGMAKIHKPGCPLRPVLSALNTAEYSICKWLEAKIKPFYNNKWSVTSTQSFVECLNSIKPQQSDVCVSFDIKSLYTNVPLDEVIDDVAEVLYGNETDSIFKTHQKKLTKQVFKNLLKKCSKSVFLHNGHVYQQTDGLSMGSSLAPILANWFVANIEDKLLKDPTIKQPKFYRRYVDDIFAVFHCEADKHEFYNRLNEAHKNLRFTMESMCPSSRTLPFLDVKVRFTPENQLETSVYRKPTNTGVLINYEATAPQKWKQSIIKGFLVRARRICSSGELLNKEIASITDMFMRNGYPKPFLDKIIREFNDEKSTIEQSETREVETEEEELKPAYFVLPYIGKASEKLHKRVRREMLQHNINLKAAYRTTKVGSYFCLKQSIPRLFKSCVVYDFKCPLDKDIRYIGETERPLFVRIEDHCSRISGENAKPSAIRDHMLGCDACTSANNIAESFSVMKTCGKSDVLSQEALSIKRFKPTLNVQLGPYRGSRVPSNIFS
jgi:hypothetical protein